MLEALATNAQHDDEKGRIQQKIVESANPAKEGWDASSTLVSNTKAKSEYSILMRIIHCFVLEPKALFEHGCKQPTELILAKPFDLDVAQAGLAELVRVFRLVRDAGPHASRQRERAMSTWVMMRRMFILEIPFGA
jgi:hypothetical protein